MNTNSTRYVPPQEPRVRKMPPSGIWPLILGLLYGVSPLDLIPDVIPLLGLADDAAVIVTAILLAVNWGIRRSKARRQIQ